MFNCYQTMYIYYVQLLMLICLVLFELSLVPRRETVMCKYCTLGEKIVFSLESGWLVKSWLIEVEVKVEVELLSPRSGSPLDWRRSVHQSWKFFGKQLSRQKYFIKNSETKNILGLIYDLCGFFWTNGNSKVGFFYTHISTTRKQLHKKYIYLNSESINFFGNFIID